MAEDNTQDIEFKNSSEYRINCFKKINAIINDKSKTKIIEKSIYNAIINNSKDAGEIRRSWTNKKFVDKYVNLSRHIIANLDPNSHIKSNYLYNAIINNEIDLTTVGSLTPAELCPEKWDQIIREKMEKENVITKVKTQTVSSDFKCRKCKGSNLLFNLVQLRSADEGMNTLVTCSDCQFKFTI